MRSVFAEMPKEAQMTGPWEPIAHASQDGTWVLGWHPEWDTPVCVCWERAYEAWTDGEGPCDPTPTHCLAVGPLPGRVNHAQDEREAGQPRDLTHGYCPRCQRKGVPSGMGAFTGCMSCGWRPNAPETPPRGANAAETASCEHLRTATSERTWLETCRDCGAWRDCVSGHQDTWFWREPGSFARLGGCQTPPLGARIENA